MNGRAGVEAAIRPDEGSRRRWGRRATGSRRGPERSGSRRTATLAIGALAALLAAALLLPAGAAAAECTTTFELAEGAWQTAANWSTEEVPGAEDVACIGPGKTAEVTSGSHEVSQVLGEGALQIGEGSLKVLGTEEPSEIGELVLEYEGTLSGPATVKVAEFFEWASASTMSGSGKTVLLAGSSGAVTTGGGSGKLVGRTLANEGSLSVNSGKLALSEGATLENKATLTVNYENGTIISGGSGGSLLNTGTLQKTSGTGNTQLNIDLTNEGTLKTESGALYARYASTWTLASKSTLEGDFLFKEGAGAAAGSFNGKEASVTIRESSLTAESGAEATLGSLELEYKGEVNGPGTLEITETLAMRIVSEMSGSGTTVLGSSASASLVSGGGQATIDERTFVNEGAFTVAEANLGLAEGATFENKGTLTVNTVSQGAISGSGATAPTIVNEGALRKTEGASTWIVNVDVENTGTLEAATGTMYFRLGDSIALEDGSVLKGALEFQESSVQAEGISSSSGSVTFRETALSLGGETSEIANLRLEYETVVSGSYDLQIDESLDWREENTIGGSGTITLGPESESTLNAGATTVTLSQAELVNEGTFTQTSSSYLKLADGATLKNKGAYNLNSEPYPSWIRESIKVEGDPMLSRIVNEGTFQRTEGEYALEVMPGFKNHGVIDAQSSGILIMNPILPPPRNRYGFRCHCGDPIETATGDFSESQTDIAVGGRGVGLGLTRAYSAQAAAEAASAGAFGYGWSSSFAERLAIDEEAGEVTVVRGDGSTVPFTAASEGSFEAPAWSQATLSGDAEAGYTYTTAEQTVYGFSGGGVLDSVTDRNGNETTLAYDEAGRLEAIADPAERQISLAYDEAGHVESAEDPMGRVVKYAYEGDELKSVTMPGAESPRWQFAYDASHRMTTMTDGRGGKTSNEYDEEDRVVSQTDPAERTLSIEYAGFHTRYTNEATEAVTDQWFTSDNEPFRTTRGYGTEDASTETFTYDSAGRMLTRTDGNGHTTKYTYNEAGDRTSATDAEGNKAEWTYNSTHDVLTETTPRGETTTIERDEAGNPESISRPAPGEATQTVSFEYDAHGQPEAITDPLSRSWSYEHNSQGDLVAQTSPEGETTTWEYDKDSRLGATVSPRGNEEGAEASQFTTSYERDPQGRVTKVTDPLGHASEYAYDANGNLEASTDANGHTTTFTYNAADEPTKVEKPNGDLLQTGYDGAGQVVSQTDGNEQTTEYARDVLEQVVEAIDPLKRATTRKYDDAGNLVSETDPEERTTTYAYDKADRLTEVGYSDEGTPDAEFGYDKDGNLTAMSDGTGESSFEYDQLGRLTQAEDGHGDAVAYAYNLADEQTAITYPNGKDVTQAFDKSGRLKTVTDWLESTTSFAYDADSNLLSTTFPEATGNVDEYGYDRAGRMSEVAMKKGEETLAALGYSRDEVGQLESLESEGLPGASEEAFEYDENDRLLKAGSQSFGYDAADNLTEAPGTTNAYDAASQLETGTGVTYTFNEEGERTKSEPTGGEAPTYASSFGTEGSEDGQLQAPSDAEIDSAGNVWVLDKGNNRLQKFNPQGEYLSQFGSGGSEDGKLSSPRSVAIDSEGDLWVADSGNHRIQKFSSSGEYIAKCGSQGSGEGQLSVWGPKGIAVDAEDKVWVTDYSGRVQRFSSSCEFLESIGSYGSGEGQFKESAGIDIHAGKLWIGDWINDRVSVFTEGGEFLSLVGSSGSGDGQLNGPDGVEVDSKGDLWVLDVLNDRVEQFNAAGDYETQFGSEGSGEGQFNVSWPVNLTSDGKGGVWLSDNGNDRIEEWRAAIPTTTYEYDQAGNLTAIERPEGEAGAISESFAYDGGGLRASRSAEEATGYFTWDASAGLPLLLDDDQASYVYGPDGLPIEQISEGTATYYHHDQLGSTRMLTSSSGKATGTFTYGAYGSLAASTGTQATPLGYAGQYTDAQSGLQYLRARMYDPATGQFLTRDPIESLTREPYSYAGVNPLNATDPSGHEWRPWKPEFWTEGNPISESSLNPIPYYEREIEEWQNGASYWDSVKHGLVGACVLASDAAGAAGLAKGAAGLFVRAAGGLGAREAGGITFGHGARHLLGTGLRQGEVEAAIQSQIHRTVAAGSASGSMWGRVTVAGKTVEYRAYALQDRTIHVGTYYVVP